jgi:hypothetical protein
MDQRIRTIVDRVTNQDVLYNIDSDIDKLVKLGKHGLGSVVDSLTITGKVKTLLNLIKETRTSDIGKIKIGDYLANKLNDIYILTKEKRSIISYELQQVIKNGTELSIPIRLIYLKFKNIYISYYISVWLYENNIRDDLENVPYFQILKYILKSCLIDENIKQLVLTEFENMFTDDTISNYTKMEIADIFLLNNRRERGEEMLYNLREEFKGEGERDYDDQKNNYNLSDRSGLTVYKDSQNVHNHNINQSVLNACVCLISLMYRSDIGKKSEKNSEKNSEKKSEYKSIDEEVLAVLTEIEPECKTSVETVLQRVQIDESRFKSDSNIFSMYDVFTSLWKYIKQHKGREELLKRLIEEIYAMEKYCSSGHIGRFINVIQGYTENENLQVHISNDDQIKSVISHYLDTQLLKAPDNILESMIDNVNQQPFLYFVKCIINQKLNSFLEEYGQVHEHILKEVKRYTRFEKWNVDDGLLIFQY